MNVMQKAWEIHRKNAWFPLPFDRKEFASCLRSAHWILKQEREGIRHTISEEERKRISMGSNMRPYP